MKNRNLFDVINQWLDLCLLNIEPCLRYILAEERTVFWGYGISRTSDYIHVYSVIWKKWLTDNLKGCNMCVRIIKIYIYILEILWGENNFNYLYEN